MDIREAYAESLNRDGYQRDEAQEEVISLLYDLQQRIQAARPGRTGLLSLFDRQGSKPKTVVKGLYVWGGVGRGKTFLMDLFFETLAIDEKRRIHFHRMLREVHVRLALLNDVEDPIDRVAADIAAETRILCFDEFFVGDIGDAMILGRLLDGLFRRGVTLVATSNTRPDDLYSDGLQRQRFLPAIELLNNFTHVVEMTGDVDYRLRLLQQSGTYLAPDNHDARRTLQQFFDDSASSEVAAGRPLEINSREIIAHRCAKGIAWFEFQDICDGPRSQNDYIEIARWYPTVIVSGVPQLDQSLDNQARRFIALVDEFYDRRVKLIVSATAAIDCLYCGNKLAFEFDRTVSRLIEMQSTEYLAAPHLA